MKRLFMKKNKAGIIWTAELLDDYNIFTDGDDLYKWSQDNIDSNIEQFLSINTPYPLLKTLGGVSIEIGEVNLFPIKLDEIIELLNNFVEIIENKNISYIPIQNVDFLQIYLEKRGLKIPQVECCEGYIDNNELINFYKDELGITTLQFKYKDGKGSTFILYQLAFLKTAHDYFMFQIQFY